MIADTLLSRLGGCRHVGRDRWIAKCPAHDDGRPSLAIRELEGNRVLVHCFAGCRVMDVLAAVGLEFDALYHSRDIGHRKPERHPFPAADILRCVQREILIAAVAALTLANGRTLTDTDHARLLLASERLTAAVTESGYD